MVAFVQIQFLFEFLQPNAGNIRIKKAQQLLRHLEPTARQMVLLSTNLSFQLDWSTYGEGSFSQRVK